MKKYIAILLLLLLVGSVGAVTLPIYPMNSSEPFRYRTALIQEETLTVLRAGNGTGIYINTLPASLKTGNDSVAGNFTILARTLYSFDLSGVPAGATITSATLSLWGRDKYADAGSGSLYAVITNASPANPSIHAYSDYQRFGQTILANNISYASWSSANTTYNNFTLNAAGLSLITGNIGGNVSMMMRTSWDVDGVFGGTYTNASDSAMRTFGSNMPGTSLDPILTLEYTTGVTAAFSANTTTGYNPLGVAFTDASYGGVITSYSWAYKNATVGWTSFSAAASPTYSFPTGTYDINLTVSDGATSDSEIKTGYITVSPVAGLAILFPMNSSEPYRYKADNQTETLAVIRASNGTGAYYNTLPISLKNANTTYLGNFTVLARALYSFNLSDIPAGSTITSVKLSTWGRDKYADAGSANLSAVITNASPANPAIHSAAGYQSFGQTILANNISYASWNSTNTTYNNFTFNAAGIAYIQSKLGTNASFMMRTSWDVDGVYGNTPTNSTESAMRTFGSNMPGTTLDPFLTIEYGYSSPYLSNPLFSHAITQNYNTAMGKYSDTAFVFRFVDASTNSPTAWTWKVNNVTGNNTEFTYPVSTSDTVRSSNGTVLYSSNQNPLITLGVGNWSVRLAATNAYGVNTSAANSYFVNISWGYPNLVNSTGIQFFPSDNIWNVPINDLPVDSHSATWIYGIQSNSGNNLSYYWGMPINIVDNKTPHETVTFRSVGVGESQDPGPYPIPDYPRVQGGFDYYESGDHHLLIADRGDNHLYELYSYHGLDYPTNPDTYYSGAVWNMSSNDLRPIGASVDVAGLPMMPGVIRYDELMSGNLKHAMRFTIWRHNTSYVWPARWTGLSITNGTLPGTGQRFRLKASYDTSGFSAQPKAILDALKIYGFMISDNGARNRVYVDTDSRFSGTQLNELQRVPMSAFEAVDVSSLMVDVNSGQTIYAAPVSHFYMNVSTLGGLIDYNLTYGSSGNPTGNPIGGKVGYDDIYISTDPRIDYTVSTVAALISATTTASAGDIIFVPGNATIDLTGRSSAITIPAGVTLASDRGYAGSNGGLIKRDAGGTIPTYGSIVAGGNNVRITGLRIQGAWTSYNYAYAESLIKAGIGAVNRNGFEVDNNEIYYWTYAGVDLDNTMVGTWDANIHHNYIHDISAQGYGYGVLQQYGNTLIEGNVFNRTRHATIWEGCDGEVSEWRYNTVGETSTNPILDCHQHTGDGVSGGQTCGNWTHGGVSGDSYWVHHNTVTYDDSYVWNLYGTPATGAYFYNNEVETGLRAYSGTDTRINMFNNYVDGTFEADPVIYIDEW